MWIVIQIYGYWPVEGGGELKRFKRGQYENWVLENEFTRQGERDGAMEHVQRLRNSKGELFQGNSAAGFGRSKVE